MSAQPARVPSRAVKSCCARSSAALSILTFNRPEKRNALSEEVIAALHAALDEIAIDKKIRALVVASQGPGFSSG